MKNYTLYPTVKLLTILVGIPSVFPNEQGLSRFIEKYLHSLNNCSIERVPVSKGRDNIIATIGNAKKYPCFYGHMDTVEPDQLWVQNPYKVTIKQGIAKGLGVTDMKGGIAVILLVAKYASENNLAIKLAFGVDEEQFSEGSFILTKNSFFDDVCIIISAESGQVINKNQPFAVNYGRMGRIVLQCEIQGLTAHAARSDLAINAIFKAGRLLQLIQNLKFKSHPQLGKTEILPFEIKGLTNSFSIPEQTEVKFNVLTTPGTSGKTVLAKIKSVAKKNNIKVLLNLMSRPTPYMESYQVDLDHPLIIKMGKLFQQHKVTPVYARSVADENRFANDLNIPVISLGPVGGGDHTADEWVKLDSLEKVLEVYKEIIQILQNI